MSESTDSQLVHGLADLKTAINELRNELVRKDVYIAHRESDQRTVAEVAKDVGDIQATLRWLSRALIASLVLPLITSVIVFYISQQVVS